MADGTKQTPKSQRQDEIAPFKAAQFNSIKSDDYDEFYDNIKIMLGNQPFKLCFRGDTQIEIQSFQLSTFLFYHFSLSDQIALLHRVSPKYLSFGQQITSKQIAKGTGSQRIDLPTPPDGSERGWYYFHSIYMKWK